MTLADARAHESCTESVDVPAQRGPAPTRAVRVLVADDDADIRHLTSLTLTLYGDDLVVLPAVCDGAAALAGWRLDRPDVLVLDHRMPGLTGLDVAAVVLAEDPGAAIVLFSASLDPVTVRWAQTLGLIVLGKTDVARLPDVVRDLAAARGRRPGP